MNPKVFVNTIIDKKLYTEALNENLWNLICETVIYFPIQIIVKLHNN